MESLEGNILTLVKPGQSALGFYYIYLAFLSSLDPL
ncbi:hypothetical protein JOC48_001090 [Aquibacillus albus]|uniref:Uncharacterized protein n=1 Tax=Aquibacillus albus TaxID=1168171 RepID=A0ABS2MXK7_9BACI|nr:hypothetical protein [Aquibacillus albus]